MRLGIDASNIGGGGGITHLKELLSALAVSSDQFGIVELTVFSSQKVLDLLADSPILTKVSFPELNKGLLQRVAFQLFHYDAAIKKRCDVLFSLTGDYIGSFQPVIGMSRNMLLYERDIWRDIKSPKEIFRFWLNFKKQQRCFKNADGIIFISKYAQEYANRSLDISHKAQKIISHGVSSQFNGAVMPQKEISEYSFESPFNFLYVSTVHVYKNHCEVVHAISRLRAQGYPVSLTLIGGVIFKPAGDLLMETIHRLDPKREFVFYEGHVPYEAISKAYKKASGIIFASNCENMPNILMESMASGVPILCSDKAPMPEFLKDNGFYFNCKAVDSIELALIDFLKQPDKRATMAHNNIKEIKNYTWDKTAKATFSFISEVYLKQHHVQK